MKKLIVIVIFVLMFALAGCGGNDTPAGETAGSFEDEVGGQRAIRLGFEGGLCQAAIPLAHVRDFSRMKGWIARLS